MINVANIFHRNDGLGKSKQIGVPFRSAEECAVVKQGIADMADLANESKGNVAASILHRAITPIAGSESWFLQIPLIDAARGADYSDPKVPVGISAGLIAAFDELSMGVEHKPAHPHGLPYVQFAGEMFRENSIMVSPETDKNDFLDSYNEIKRYLLKQGAKPTALQESTAKSKGKMRAYPLIQLVLDNWSALKDRSATFEFLAYVILITENWRDTAAQRMRFRDICIRVNTEVVLDREERARKRKKAQKDAALTKLNLADGNELLIPQSWIVVNPEEAPRSKNAGVIEVKNANQSEVPHMVYLLDEKGAWELSDEEYAEVIRCAASKCPKLLDISKQHVELEYGPDGGITNYDAYISAPSIGFFPVMDESSVNEYSQPPYGAVVRRSTAGG